MVAHVFNGVIKTNFHSIFPATTVQMMKLRPQLEKYKQQDILIQEHLEREREEEMDAERQKQVIGDADGDDVAADDDAVDPQTEHRDVATITMIHSL